MKKLPIALTMGDPAGVGADISLKAWIRYHENGSYLPTFFMIDDADRLTAMASHLGLPIPIKKIKSPSEAAHTFSHAIPVVHHPLAVPSHPGKPNPANAGAVIDSIKAAVQFTQNREAAAIVTNPIAKNILYEAGFKFPGHTEYLAHLTGQNATPVMMLSCEALRVVLATVHVSILEAARTLSTDIICDVARITHMALKNDFAITNPTLAIAGLNPHAGEDGTMGREEIDIIVPAIERLRAQGINALGPFPPDTMFTAKALATYDAAVCMYHDQGLIPFKTLDFERGVNTTLGLNFVRTSPDHGTAFDIAGTGQASELSLMAALNMAEKISQTRR